MNFLEVNETTSLNTSITIHPPVPLPEDPINNSNNISLPKIEQETLNTTIQKLNLPHYISHCDSASVATKSNYSSINNILPCPDSEHNRSKRDDNIYKPTEKSQFSNTLPTASSNNPDISITRQNLNLQTRLTTSDKPPMKAMSRPPLNPNEVAKGLSALHSKVDELLRKKSQPRGRDSSCGDSERHHRALSTDARSETRVSPQFILTSFQKEPPTPDILSGRTCHSIEIGFNKQQEEHNLSAQLNEQREISPIKFTPNVYQDLALKEKTMSNPVKASSPSNDKFHLSAKVTSFSPIVKGSFNLDSFKPNSTQPISIRNTEDSFDNKGEERSRPRYDERKLDQIISRIKDRNSVSPAPGPRGSITEADMPAPRYSVTSHNVSVNVGRRPQDSWTEKKETRADERNDVSSSNWQLNTCPAGDVVNERDIHANVTTTMFEAVEKKRSISSPKFRDMPPAPEADKKNRASFIRAAYPGNEAIIQENKPVYGNTETKNYGNIPASNYTVADIIKELKANKTIKVNEPVKTESFLDRTRALAQTETRTRAGDVSVNAGLYQEEKTLTRNYKRGREGVTENESSKVFGSLENDMDSVMEANRQKQTVMNNDADMEYKRYTTAIQQGCHTGSQRKRSMDKVERPESNNRTRNVVERSERNVYEEESMTNRLDEDSLLDESVFLSKEETTVRGSTNRMFTTGNDERQSKRPKVCNRTELFNTPFRKKYLQDDTDLSDFDFDRSKMENTERDVAKESFRGFMLKVNKVEEDSARKYDAKRQKRSSSISMSNEKIVPKTEMPRRGVVGRPGY